MTNTINFNKLSSTTIIAIGALAVLVMALLVFPPKARAEYPNILAGQNLTVGSTGQNVVVLQGLMSELGYLSIPSGIPFGYYGTMTKNAVARYQANTSVSPAVGYFGPVTKLSMYDDFSRHGWLSLLGW